MRCIFCAITALGLSVTGAAAQAPADWDRLVAAAKTEGVVTLYTGLVGNRTSRNCLT